MDVCIPNESNWIARNDNGFDADVSHVSVTEDNDLPPQNFYLDLTEQFMPLIKVRIIFYYCILI